jgi:hypothetical protein
MFMGMKGCSSVRYFFDRPHQLTGEQGFCLRISWLAILLVLFLVTPGPLQGQRRDWFKTYEVRSTGLQLKGDFMQMREQLISPLPYKGFGGHFEVYRIKYGEEARNFFSIGFRTDFLKNKHELRALLFRPEFMYSHTRLTELSGDKDRRILLGLAATGKPGIYKFRDEDANHFYWTNHYTLDFHFIYEHETGRDSKFWVELQVPLAGVMFRPEAERPSSIQLPRFFDLARETHSKPSFISLHNFQSVTLRTFYDLMADDSGSISVGYELEFITHASPSRIAFLTHSLAFRFLFNQWVM